MTVRVSDIEGVPVAQVAGILDDTNAGELTEALRGAVPNAAMGLVLDLTEITEFDSAGLHVIFQTAQRLDRRQQRLYLVVEPESLVADVVALSDLGAYVAVDHDVRHAVRRVRDFARWA
jgi:anti-anti-sigma factor